MEQKKFENTKEKQAYETPRLREHGSIEQVTGQQPTISGLQTDGSTNPI